MDRYAVFVPKLLPRGECFVPDASISCKGCGEALAIRLVYKALGSALMHKGTWKIPFKQPVPELKGVDKDDAAMPALLRLAKEDKRVLSICFDNEARTGKKISTEFWRKRMPAVAVAEGVAYVATASPGYPFDLIAKVKKACSAPGDAYLHILCPCPVGWDFDPSLSVQVGKLAVDSNLFPLYEVLQGTYFINAAVPKPRPVKEYLRLQGRFQQLSATDLAEIQQQSALEYSRLSAASKQGERAHERH
jgi:pyruvate/2-oxoacid:ferredoxin oxidoreductase beta subunit